MARRHSMRTLENNGKRAEVVGPSRCCALWINGVPYKKDIRTLRSARELFERWCKINS